ncbi:MAG: methyltransferase domain-containing protein [Bacteroidota bacterium]
MLYSVLKSLIHFPLFKDDKQPFYHHSPEVLKQVAVLNNKIKTKEYKHIINNCLCGNKHPEKDILLAQKDMFGITLDSLICSQCGLVRSKEILDDESTAKFYTYEYKSIFYHMSEPNNEHFEGECERGEQFFNLLKEQNLLDKIETVFESGCGMGGNMYPLLKAQKKCSGCDFAKDYIEFGRQKGFDLYEGELSDQHTLDDSQDLIILSHVMEHFNEPIKEMQKLIRKIKKGKYILIEVPGMFADNPYKYYPIRHLQKAHVYNFFYADFLKLFMERLGLQVIYINERCTLIAQKPEDYKEKDINKDIYTSNLSKYPNLIKNLFLENYIKHEILSLRSNMFLRKVLNLFK